MNMKKMIRKVAAVGAGLTMVGATLMGAMAANLNEYPTPFVSDGVFDAVLVVGDTAAPIDIIGITDIAMALQSQMIVEEVVETEEGTTTVSDGVVESELPLGDAFVGDTYDDGDITVLADDEVRYNSEDYGYEEQIIIAGTALVPASAEENEDYEDVSALEIAAGTEDICYRFVFDDGDEVPFVTTDDLEFEFLGLDLTITGADDAATDEVDLSTATEAWMDYGEVIEATIEGVDYTIELGNVYDTEAIFTVNGVTENVGDGDTEDFDFDDFEIEVLDVLNDDGTEFDAVKIKYGSTTSETAKDGEAAEMLGYGDDDDEAEWVWDIDVAAGDNITHIGVCYNQDRDEIESELDEDWELPVLFEGDQINFPNEFASIQYAATHFDGTYQTVSIEYDDSLTFTSADAGDPGFSNAQVWIFDSSEEVWTYGGKEYEKVYVSQDFSVNAHADLVNITVCTKDSNGNKDCALEDINISSTQEFLGLDLTTDDETLQMKMEWEAAAAGSEVETITLLAVAGYDGADYSNGNLVFNASSNDGESDTDNEIFVDLATDIDLTAVEENFLLDYGIIVNTPEGNLESGDYGKLVLQVPDEAVTIDIAIAASSAVAGSSGVVTQTVTQIEVGATKLASEVADVTAQNAIVVGGPAVNMAAAALLGNPTQEEILELFTPGQAMVKLFDNDGNIAMLIAGYDGEDTRTAARVVANGGITAIDGTEAVVTTLTEDITAPVEVEEVVEEEAEEEAEEEGE